MWSRQDAVLGSAVQQHERASLPHLTILRSAYPPTPPSSDPLGQLHVTSVDTPVCEGEETGVLLVSSVVSLYFPEHTK